jgi:hypothetical protein
MNKWQIICPVAAMGIFLLLAIPRYANRMHMAHEDAITWRAYCAGRELERTTNSTLLASIDPQLHEVLVRFLTTPSEYEDVVYKGDETPPLGDGTATHRLYLSNADGQWIALRLRNDPALGKFQVLGCYTPTNAPEHTFH